MMLCFTVLLLSAIMGIVAFVPLPITTRGITCLHGAIGDDVGDTRRNNTKRDDSNRIGDTPFDVEYARQRLENLLSNPKDETDKKSNVKDNSNDGNNITKKSHSIFFSKIILDYGDGVDFSLSSFPPPPPLSSIERERRLGEIKLLGCLNEGDEVVSELWNHWYSERGSSAKSRLEHNGGLLANPQDWDECERNLIELVDEYGVYFVEPVNLLATLYFLQGKLELSYKLCEIILALKPYHIGALSGIVQVALGLRDPIASREWALKQLPRASPGPALDKDDTSIDQREPMQQVENPLRVEWVKRAVNKAKELLDQAERRTKEDFFGKPETYYDVGGDNDTEIDDISGFNYSDDEIDGSAWQ